MRLENPGSWAEQIFASDLRAKFVLRSFQDF
jgi:hypothetical protein